MKTLEERVNFYIETSNNINKCLIPILKTNGYYQIQFQGKGYLLHRLVLAQKLDKNYNEINITRHLCNNKQCINPDHLEEGTRSENALDTLEYNKVYKLSKEQVQSIKMDLTNWDLSSRGNKSKFDEFWSKKLNIVSPANIKSIRLNYSWKNKNNIA